MVDVLSILLLYTLFFLAVSAIVAAFVLTGIELFKNKGHALRPHSGQGCDGC